MSRITPTHRYAASRLRYGYQQLREAGSRVNSMDGGLTEADRIAAQIMEDRSDARKRKLLDRQAQQAERDARLALKKFSWE